MQPLFRATAQIVTLIVALALLPVELVHAAVAEVRIGAAKLQGDTSADGAVTAFLGIPFAMPPTGERRWRAPETLTLRGSLDAREFAPACMQSNYLVDWYHDLVRRFEGDSASFPEPEFSEDCLYLNIWTPNVEAPAALPVMVWIHGGGHRGGWSYEPNYIGDQLARHGVVVVSIAYRLDVFGFYSHPQLETANFGLLDQVAALEWVRDHIDSFGGDPGNITVFGESAGAASIAYLMASPLAAGLFHRAIHQSAGYQALNFDTRADFVDQGLKVQEKALEMHSGNNDESAIDALRRVPAKTLLDAADDVFTDYRPDVVVDGSSVTESFAESIATGRIAGVDLLIGTNADEWRMYLEPDDLTRQLDEKLEQLAPANPANLATLLGNDVPDLHKLDRLITAEQFVCPSLQLAAAVAQKGRASYVYYFNRVRYGPQANAIGAYHGAELPYVFDKHDAWMPTDDIDRLLTRRMMQLWTSFARTGQPSAEGTANWKPFEIQHDATLFLGEQTRLAAHPDRALCELLPPVAQAPHHE